MNNSGHFWDLLTAARDVQDYTTETFLTNFFIPEQVERERDKDGCVICFAPRLYDKQMRYSLHLPGNNVVPLHVCRCLAI